ncbi:unnamed protein product [Closterium sp. Yama58-4]|nr:unnamed protein product [Closterium sp. Yama58-4]
MAAIAPPSAGDRRKAEAGWRKDRSHWRKGDWRKGDRGKSHGRKGDALTVEFGEGRSVVLEGGRRLAEVGTWGIGGPAEWLAEVTTVDEMAAVLRFCHTNSIRVVVIGKGSNCLFEDRGYKGCVIVNRIAYKRVELRCAAAAHVDIASSASHRDSSTSNSNRNDSKDSNGSSSSSSSSSSNSAGAIINNQRAQIDALVQVGGGYPFNLLGVECSREGLSGLEFAGGIPGTVGGAVFMNAGADGQETADCLLSVDVLSPTGTLLSFSRSDLTFAYRHSPFQHMRDCAAIVGATFGLRKTSEARDRQRKYMDRRRQSQPIADRSVGCIFRNPAPPFDSAPPSTSGSSSPPAGLPAAGASAVPLPASAGALIDRAGLKDLCVGDAFVSPMHANFLVNGGACSSEDMEGLIVEVKKRVKEEFGVELVEESRAFQPSAMASAVALQGSTLTSSGLLAAPRLSSNKPRCASLASTLVPLPRKLTSSRTTPAQPFSRQRCSVAVNAQAPPSSTPQDESVPASRQLPCLPSSLTEATTSLLDVLKAAVKPALAALLISAVLAAGAPDAALAAQGGGRIGGSGFGASRMRSYAPPPSAPRGGYSYSAPPVIVGPSVPFFAPSPFFFFGPSVAFGGGGGLFNLLVIGIVIWFVSQSVMGFLSSAQEEGVWQETQRSSVVRLQVGLLGSARRLQRDLDRIADRADASSPEGLHYILQETVLALLRNPDYCIYGFSSSEVNSDSYAGEAAFNRMSMEERSKFKEETLVNVDGIRRRITRNPSNDRMNSEYIVVTVLAATEGTLRLPEIKSASDLREALTRLGSIPADELQAVEVLWTPQDDEDTLTERDLLLDYPRLRPL